MPGSFIRIIGVEEVKKLVHGVYTKLPPTMVNGTCQKTAQRAARSARGILGQAPYRDRRGGQMAQNVRVIKSSDNSYSMGVSAQDDFGFDYSRAVALGAVPHEIPNNPQWAGKMHPGVSGRTPTFNFHTKARDSAFMVVDGIINNELRRVIK